MEPIGNDSKIFAAYQSGSSDALVLDGNGTPVARGDLGTTEVKEATA